MLTNQCNDENINIFKLLHNEINCVIPNISGDAGEKMIIFSQGLIWSES